jgi:hypothetical protein
MTMKNSIRIILAALVVTGAVACSNEISKSASPIELIVTNSQTLSRIDLFNQANCNQSVGTIQMQAIEKNTASGSTNTTFNQVRITRYQVSYVRTDGGKQVPASFVRSIDTLLTPGSTSTALTGFLIMQQEALTQAPFAALFPNNGGRDPDTGLATVRMDVIVTVFGETLAGTNVSASTRFPLDFCYNCNGCA